MKWSGADVQIWQRHSRGARSLIRACLFAEVETRPKRRPRSAIVDKRAAAEPLALLGHSQIARNLAQLAQAAKIGALVIEDRDRAQINDAHAQVMMIRDLLVAELGTSE